METESAHLYRQLPQVDEYLRGGMGKRLLERHPRPLVLAGLRTTLAALREEIAAGAVTEPDRLAEQVDGRLRRLLENRERAALQPVINATGVILQTNLGRAPLSEEAIARIAEVARGYCNLEYDLDGGTRGRRGECAEDLLLRAAGCDPTQRAAVVVNNCAAAVLLALNSVAEGGEVIVSRGELVEIGGGFRVPEILRKSGARLVEVGTTNRTRLADYAGAISPETRAILRVHRSNFAMVGFTEQPALEALAELGRSAGIPVIEDQGTGCLLDLSAYGVASAPTFAASVHSGMSLVCASGDKLLGGAQCGLAVGTHSLIEAMRRNPLYRAIRADKLTYAALEPTLLAYLSGRPESIPTIRMLSLSAESIRVRCEWVSETLAGGGFRTEVVPTTNRIGGGTSTATELPSFGVAMHSPVMSADELALRLRRLRTPIIARIHDGGVLLDLRTVAEEDDERVVGLLLGDLAEEKHCKGEDLEVR